MGDIREAKEAKEIKEFEKFRCVRSLRKLEKNGHYDKNLKFSNLSKFLKFSNLPPPAQEGICCQKGAECYTRQKCRRWVVLCVRPIDGIFC